MAAATASTTTRSPRPWRPRVALTVLLTASFTLAVDFSILNVALPSIGADVGFGLENLQWIATAFALCAAGFTLLFGRVADLFGKRRLFLAGMALLGVASVVGGLAADPALLLIARAAQGVATAAVTPAALALLTSTFPEGSARDRALGLNGALMAGGFTTGAILGGVLTEALSWRWAFFLNVPVAAAVLVTAPIVLAEHRPAQRPRLDLPGALFVTLGLLAVIYGLTTAGARSWADLGAWGALLLGAALLAGFYAVERHVDQPLIPVSILARRSIAWGNIAGLLAFATETSLVFLLTLYLQETLGYSPLGAGLALALLGVGTVIGGIVGPRAIGRVGARSTIVLGFVIQGAATLPLAVLGADSGWITLLLGATFIGGVANLAVIVGFMVTSTSGLPNEEQGMATGLATMSQQAGITLGTPIMSAVVATTVAQSHGAASALLSGITTAVAVNAAMCFGGAAALALGLPGRRANAASEVGARPGLTS